MIFKIQSGVGDDSRIKKEQLTKPAHGNSKNSANTEELLIRVTEPRGEFEGDEQEVIHDKRPFPAVAIACNTEDHSADGPQHQHHRDAPCDVRRGLAEFFAQLRRGQ